MKSEKNKANGFTGTVKETWAWIKEIPHKLEVLLNNLWVMVFNLSGLVGGAYWIARVVPTFQGYNAIAALIGGAVVAVGCGAGLVHFLVKQGR